VAGRHVLRELRHQTRLAIFFRDEDPGPSIPQPAVRPSPAEQRTEDLVALPRDQLDSLRVAAAFVGVAAELLDELDRGVRRGLVPLVARQVLRAFPR
jgi:hypothetical protein